MDSGIVELQTALNHLSSLTRSGTDRWDSGLRRAGDYADGVSDNFIGVNGALASGWETVSDFYKSIDTSVVQSLEYVRETVQRYVDMTMENERKEEATLQAVNDNTAAILAEMGIE